MKEVKFNQDNPQTLNIFLTRLRRSGKSENTIDSYQKDLRMFFQIAKTIKGLDNVKVDLDFIKNISSDDVEEYLDYIQYKLDNSDTTRARKLASIQSFYKFLKTKKLIDDNPCKELDTIKTTKNKTPVHLTIEEAKNLLKVVEESDNIRDYTIMTLFLNCGLRTSELCDLNIDEVEESVKEDKIVVLGKGNKERVISLNNTTKETLSEYLNYRKALKNIRKEKSKNALFLTIRKDRVTIRTIEALVEKYRDMAGINKNITPHDLRHTFASILYQSGVDIYQLQKLLGHSSITTTQIYTHINDDEMKKAVNMNLLND